MELSVLSAQFCCEPKTILKISLFLKNDIEWKLTLGDSSLVTLRSKKNYSILSGK